MSEIIDGLPNNAGLFAVDSFLNYYQGGGKEGGKGDRTKVGGLLMKLEIHLAYLSTGPRRSVIWRDAYVCETRPIQESLIANEAANAKKLVDKAIEDLLPWIRRDLTELDASAQQLPFATLKFRAGWKMQGYLLQDNDEHVVLRGAKGVTRVVPKAYVKKLKLNTSPG